MKKKKFLLMTIILSLFVVISIPAVTNAIELIPAACKNQSTENKLKCTLEDFEQLFANAYTIGIVYVGAIAVLFIIIGGFMLLLSHGRQDRIDLGKQIISHTIIGVVIVMTAFLLVSILQKQLFQADEEYLLQSGNSCAGKENGDSCSLLIGTGANANLYTQGYVCYEGVCGMTKCRYASITDPTGFSRIIPGTNTLQLKSCMDVTKCDGSTVSNNYCPGKNDIKCCYPAE